MFVMYIDLYKVPPSLKVEAQTMLMTDQNFALYRRLSLKQYTLGIDKLFGVWTESTTLFADRLMAWKNVISICTTNIYTLKKNNLFKLTRGGHMFRLKVEQEC